MIYRADNYINKFIRDDDELNYYINSVVIWIGGQMIYVSNTTHDPSL